MKVKTVDAARAHQIIRRQLLFGENGQLWTIVRAVGRVCVGRVLAGPEPFVLVTFSAALPQPLSCFGAHQLIGATRQGL